MCTYNYVCIYSYVKTDILNILYLCILFFSHNSAKMS